MSEIRQKLEAVTYSNQPIEYCELSTEILGKAKDISVTIDSVKDYEDNIVGAICILRDITDVKKYEKATMQQEKLASIGQMAAGIVHEIKNPLTSIKGFSQILQMRAEEDSLKQYCSIIVEEVDRVNEIVTDLLQFAKPKPPQKKDISLNGLIESMLTMIENQAFLKKIETKIKLDDNIPIVKADENQLKQVLLNMAQNSFQAMEACGSGSLSIETKYLPELMCAEVLIRDTGKGIDKEHLKKIGTPFYTTKDKGTGLGLSICYQIVKEHKGKIFVESEVGKGTVFTIRIPVSS